jgi:hypothetical protein
MLSIAYIRYRRAVKVSRKRWRNPAIAKTGIAVLRVGSVATQLAQGIFSTLFLRIKSWFASAFPALNEASERAMCCSRSRVMRFRLVFAQISGDSAERYARDGEAGVYIKSKATGGASCITHVYQDQISDLPPLSQPARSKT